MQMILFEAAWQASMETGGMGWILQNSDLKFHSQSSTHRLHVSSAIVAEALSISSALLATQAAVISFLVCLSDCRDLIHLLKAGGQVNKVQ